MRPLRYVILGAGGIAGVHADNYAKQIDVTPVGFCDINPEQLKKWKKRYPDAAVSENAVELLEKTKPDLVSVCSPNSSHAELTRYAFAAGAHVLCEKPMGMTVDETLGMEAASAKKPIGLVRFNSPIAAWRRCGSPGKLSARASSADCSG